MSVQSYLKETKQEMTKVSWPKRNEVIMVTIAVVAISLVVGYVLGLFDSIFSKGLLKIISR
jgi:preprotein translocase subunit SecE